jgi:spore germination cell wall hydrolase CwlJ-like protein
MNKRNELKKRNAELYLKKNIFSGKYVVRNILAGTIAVTVVATAAGVVGVIADNIGDSIKTRPEQNAIQVKAQEVAMADISFDSIPQLDSSSISVLLSDMGGAGEIVIESREKNLVTYAPGEFDKKFVGIDDDVNVHTEASEDAEVVGTIYKGVVGDIISSDGEWVNISSGSVTGYVKAEFILSGDDAAEYASDYYTVVGTVNDNGVYIRSDASRDADYVATADMGDTYEVEDLSTVDSEWVCVEVDDDITGYIYSEFIDVEGTYPVAVLKGELPEATGAISEIKTTESAKANAEATGSITEESTNKNTDKKQNTATETTEKTTTETVTTTEAASTTEATVTARGSISLSESDIDLMATVLTLECGGESYEGQLAVANVILNRLQSGVYGSTVSDVVYSPNQFSVVGTNAFYNCLANGSAQTSCVQAVKDACAGSNNIGSYTYFRTTQIADTSSYSSYLIIGNHVFY